ncbi:MAG: hypothetical protein E7812_17590 [Phenylobacterium sp.]|nr:MAG: hypothetical protein E7812_17590 [Phenylobacterium sp.]
MVGFFQRSTQQPSLKTSATRTAMISSCLLALAGITLQSCQASNSPPTGSNMSSRTPPSAQDLADSLVLSTREFCIRYVVDGEDLADIVGRLGVSKHVYDVHGKAVTRYMLDRPGFPEVTIAEEAPPHSECSVLLRSVDPSDQMAIVALFNQDLRLSGYKTTKPHHVPTPGVLDDGSSYSLGAVCVHGKATALLSILPSSQVRGHLLGAQLGGSGDVAENLVTLEQNPANSPVMRSFENQVRAAVEGGQTVQYSSTPIYNGSNLVPRGITLSGSGSGGFKLNVTVLNPPGY